MRYLYFLLMVIGQALMSFIFIISGDVKLFDYNETAQYMASKGMVLIPLFYVGAIVVEILGGFALLIGIKPRWIAVVLFLYLIPVTIIFHDFWNLAGEEQKLQMFMFLKNLAIMGGLLTLVSSGGYDVFRRRREP